MSNQPVQTGAEKFAALQKYLGDRVDTFATVLPKNIGLTPEKFVKTVLYATHRVPGLLDCTRQSLFLAALQAADIGLPVGTSQALAHIIPYKNPSKGVTEAQFTPDYKGLIALLLDAGDVKKIDLESVHEKDEFELVRGTTGERLVHRPKWNGPRGAAVGYYALATLSDGTQKFLYMTRDEVEQVRKTYAADNSPAWAKSYDEQAKKTVFKRMQKTMRRTGTAQERLARAIEADNRAEDGKGPDYGEVVIETTGEVIPDAPAKALDTNPAPEPLKTAERVKQEVAAKAAKLEPAAASAAAGAA